ncbi:cytochrome C554 [Edwardsiella hoshinae]|uniref:Cytochrome C554 n=1 Tax=Edwardsiella hoshinae TaxID=93378 RepID=A0A376DLS1_9GAMM|nr:c-type cytochrome [Edwardsiella hoshinae]AOV97728.1 cytochrome C554 [Edwardsiella hoshinae]QPR29389.1 c-type cytochrome [Edwardsiella hoshinae]STC90632.1 Cytochrome c-554(548) [Edwardsiella hoshinae]
MKWRQSGALVLALAASSWVYAAGDSVAGQQKSATCVACHGAQGQGLPPMYPALAGQRASQLIEAMQGYKNGTRRGGQAAIMAAYLAPLNSQDIENIAAYYASLKPLAKP